MFRQLPGKAMRESEIVHKQSSGNKARMVLVAFAALLIGSSALTGCSGLVDSPEGTAPTVTDVRPIYLALDSTRWVYNFVERDSDRYTGRVTWWPLEMRMLGRLPMGQQFNGNFVSHCSVTHHLPHPFGDYGMDSLYTADTDEALVLGFDHDHQLVDPWIDLKAPLKDSASWDWQFGQDDHNGQPIMMHARVTFYNVAVALDNTLFHNVTEVSYTPDFPTDHAPSITKKWFSLGAGLIRRVEYGGRGEILREWRLHSISK